MSTCAILLVKDEADIVGYTVEYLLGQVDEVVVSDNASRDGTPDLLDALSCPELRVQHDPDPAYYQAEKTSRLAADALARGHQWVVPCDADELWHANDFRRLADFLAGLAPDVAQVQALLYNHLPGDADPPDSCQRCYGAGFYLDEQDVGRGYETIRIECPHDPPVEENPFLRIRWRQREHGALPKVACRLRPGLEIRQGNHSAYAPGSGLIAGGLSVRHFSWRTPAQYEHKLAVGYAAYAATSLPQTVGEHWRMFGSPDDPTFAERVREHFDTWFWIRDPASRPDLIDDPAPWRVAVSEEAASRPVGGVSSSTSTEEETMGETEHEPTPEPGPVQQEPVPADEQGAVTPPRARTLQDVHDDLEATLFAVQDLAQEAPDGDEAERSFAILEMKVEDAFLWAKRALTREG